MLKINLYQNKEIASFIDVLAKFRIEAFKSYPYLYKGCYEYEKAYLSAYVNDLQGLLVVAIDTKKNNKIVGISTGLPLGSSSEIVKDLKEKFIENNYTTSEYYYYGEVIVLPEYRRKGLAKKMYKAKEKKALEWGYTYACILTVNRDEGDQRKPLSYKGSEKIWLNLGFHKIARLETSFYWNTIIDIYNNTAEIANPMSCWIQKYS